MKTLMQNNNGNGVFCTVNNMDNNISKIKQSFSAFELVMSILLVVKMGRLQCISVQWLSVLAEGG
ncbi:UNVERIFIED_CONTAM: hypothetical protein FKN15_065015 [Acipenser sinensis]